MAQNREPPKRQPGRGRPFAPGNLANPGGRPKAIAWVRDLAREQTEPAIEALVECLQDESGSVRVAAANALLDRGWGKPTQRIAGEEDGAPIAVSHNGEALRLLLERLAGGGE